MAKLSPDQVAWLKEKMLSSFKFFTEVFVDPDFYDPDFHGPLCDFIQYSPVMDKLFILPRTHLKTTIITQMQALWRATKDPNSRHLIVCNSMTNAEMTVLTIMGIVQSNELYRAVFPELIPDFNKKSVRWGKGCACLKRPTVYPEGTWEAAGVGTNVIRRHYDYIYEDDTVAPTKDELSGEELMPSRDEIEKAVGFHKLTIPLLISAEGGARMFVCTRWASYDAASRIMERELGEGVREYAVYDVPAINPTSGMNNYKRFSLSTLGAIRRSMGKYMFHALYLNDPKSSDLMIFKPGWTQYYKEGNAPTDGAVTITVDPADAPTGKVTQNHSATIACRNCESGLYVLKYRKERVPEGTLINRTLDMADELDAMRIRIEVDRYANLEAGFRLEMTKREKWYAIEPVKTRGRNKEARILRLVPFFENKRVYLTKEMPELESELYQFPHSESNDLIDALSWHIMSDIEMPDMTPAEKKVKSTPATVSFEEIMDSVYPAARPHITSSTYGWRERFGEGAPLG